MGIKGLTRKAEEYAQWTTFPTEAVATRHAIIDGPALAYHVLSLCARQRAPCISAVDAMPTYVEVCQSTLAWLSELAYHGFKISAIIFDGYLPRWKKAERRSRTAESLQKLVQFRARQTDIQLGKSGGDEVPELELRRPKDSHQEQVLTPPPSFVSAIISTLVESWYQSVVKVVPGEADSYCAEMARRTPGAYILTGDSDLLVFDIGQEGRVAFFKDAEFSEDDDGRQLRMLIHHPYKLAATLEIEDMICVAYLMKQSVNRSLDAAAALSKTLPPPGLDYKDFRLQYLTHGETPILLSSIMDSRYGNIVSHIDAQDPRAIELVLQLNAGCFNKNSSKAGGPVFFFLPFLLEDVNKASAYQPSVSLRRLAYSICRLVDGDLEGIEEYSRRGLHITPTIIKTHDIPRTLDEVSGVVSSTQECLQKYAYAPLATRWRMLSVVMLIEHLKYMQKSLPRLHELSVAVLRPAKSNLTWPILHVEAQVQGILFSFLLIKHILGIFDSLKLLSHIGVDEAAILGKLRALLESLPSLAELFAWRKQTDINHRSQVFEDLKSLLVENKDVEEDGEVDGFVRQGKKQRRESKKGGTVREPVQMPVGLAGSNSQNPYAILGGHQL